MSREKFYFFCIFIVFYIIQNIYTSFFGENEALFFEKMIEQAIKMRYNSL